MTPLWTPCLHCSTSHPSSHPCHASPRHLKHMHTRSCCIQPLCILLLHSSSTSVAFVPPPPPSLCLCLVHFYFLYKKAVLSCYSASVSLSVYLCPCGRLPRCLAAGGKWGHSVGDLIRWILRGDARPLAPCGPNRRSLVLLSFSSVSLCFLVSLMSFSSVYCPKDIEVGEVFLPACSLLLLTAHL